MVVSEVLPDPTEWFRQWRREPGESDVQDLLTKFVTIGSAAYTVIAVASLMIWVGVGTTIADQILSFQVDLGLIGLGQATIVPALALVGGFAAVVYVIQFEPTIQQREILRDDINWIIGMSATTFVLAAMNVTVPFAATTSLTFIMFGASLGVLLIWRVVSRR